MMFNVVPSGLTVYVSADFGTAPAGQSASVTFPSTKVARGSLGLPPPALAVGAVATPITVIPARLAMTTASPTKKATRRFARLGTASRRRGEKFMGVTALLVKPTFHVGVTPRDTARCEQSVARRYILADRSLAIATLRDLFHTTCG